MSATTRAASGELASILESGAELAASPTELPAQDLKKTIAAVKGQAHFVLYLAEQLEDAIDQAEAGGDAAHRAFLGKVLGMYASQLETKHHGLGDRITEACQELYLLVRELDAR
jgi:hypothetical protein